MRLIDTKELTNENLRVIFLQAGMIQKQEVHARSINQEKNGVIAMKKRPFNQKDLHAMVCQRNEVYPIEGQRNEFIRSFEIENLVQIRTQGSI